MFPKLKFRTKYKLPSNVFIVKHLCFFDCFLSESHIWLKIVLLEWKVQTKSIFSFHFLFFSLKMDSDEVATSINLMPEHIKDEAKNKFKELTGFTQNSVEEIKKITSQAADRVNHSNIHDLRPKTYELKNNLKTAQILK